MTLIVLACLGLLLGLAVLLSYNRFVAQRNLVDEAWKQIDVELQRRFDLVPNLIETVKGAAAYERGVLDSVTTARTGVAAVTGESGPGRQHAENALGKALGGLLAVAEAYPTLQVNSNFRELQHELRNTEDRIAAGRRFYNGNVRALNTRVESAPSNIIAGLFKFTAASYFELDDETARTPVKVSFEL